MYTFLMLENLQQVAQQAADIIVMDDNFASIVQVFILQAHANAYYDSVIKHFGLRNCVHILPFDSFGCVLFQLCSLLWLSSFFCNALDFGCFHALFVSFLLVMPLFIWI